MPTKESLTLKQYVFLQEYAKSFNVTKAMKVAYPNMSYGAARSYGVYLKKAHPVTSKLIQKVNFSCLEKYRKIYEENYRKKIWLKTEKIGKEVVKYEVDCTPFAMEALAHISKLITKMNPL